MLPQHLKPKQNLVVPICRECHDKIHFDDVNGMYGYVHKIEKTMVTMSKNMATLKKMLDENNKLQKLRVQKKVNL